MSVGRGKAHLARGREVRKCPIPEVGPLKSFASGIAVRPMAGSVAPEHSGRVELCRLRPRSNHSKGRASVVRSLFTFFWEGGDQYNGRSIANLDATVYPAVAVPVAFANEPAHWLFVYRRGRIVDRRRSRAGRQGPTEQCPANKSAHDASGDLTVLCCRRCWRQKGGCGYRDN